MAHKACYKKWLCENGCPPDQMPGSSYHLLPPIAISATTDMTSTDSDDEGDTAAQDRGGIGGRRVGFDDTAAKRPASAEDAAGAGGGQIVRKKAVSIMAPIAHLLAQTAMQSAISPEARAAKRRGQTFVLYDDLFLKHKTAQSLECPARVDVLCGANGVLRQGEQGFSNDLLVFKNVMREASLADVLRVHEWEYVHDLISKCEIAKRSTRDRHFIDPPGHPKDTMVSGDSYKVAVMAAGAACAAVDTVLRGEAKNAFVPLRPPGHHAGPSGLVYSDDGCPAESQGFCLLNNAMIAAAYARYNYRDVITKVAVVDFDVHAGNGSCAIVRNLRPHMHTRRIAPQTSVTVPSYKPWLDDTDTDNVFFASIHLQHDNFYPRQASTKYDPSSEPEFVGGASGTLADPNFPFIVNVPMQATETTEECSTMFRKLVREQILPKLRSFAPDLLIISAGFDGHHEDIDGNRGMFHLLEDDYEWITEELIQIAQEKSEGRIVSVLEGGYHVPKSTRKRKLQPEESYVFTSALASSCAVHVKALMHA